MGGVGKCGRFGNDFAGVKSERVENFKLPIEVLAKASFGVCVYATLRAEFCVTVT